MMRPAAMLSALRELDLEQSLGLRPDYPPVAVEMSRSESPTSA